MIKTVERYVIAKRRKSPNQSVKYLADDRYEFYDSTDLTTEEDDAYKYRDEQLAKDMIGIYNLNTEDYEVKKVIITYEVI